MNQKIGQTIGYYASFIAQGGAGTIVGPTLLSLAQNTHTSPREISAIFLASPFGFLIGSFIGGRCYDRFPGHAIIASALLGMTSLLLVVPFCSSLWLLMLILFGLGVAEGFVDVGGNTLLVWLHREHLRPFMNGLHLCYGVGTFLSPFIVAQALRLTGGILWSYWTIAFLIAPIAIYIWRLPSPSLTQHEQQTSHAPLNYRILVFVLLFFLLYVGAETSLTKWIPAYAEIMQIADKVTAAYLASVFAIAFTVGRVFAVPLAARFHPAPLLVGSLSGALISVIPMLILPKSLIAVTITVIGLGLNVASIYPNMILFAEQRMKITGQVMSWFGIAASFGAMLTPWLIGQLFESSGPQVLQWAVFLTLLGSLCVLGIIKYTERRAV